MAGKELLTRREALYVMSFSALGVASMYTGMKLPHYLDYIRYRKSESFLFSTFDKDPFTVEYQSRSFQISPDTSVFSNALINVVLSEDRDRVSKRLSRFLRYNPLEVRLEESVGKVQLEDGKFYEPLGIYKGVFFGGPQLLFPSSFIERYVHAKSKRDLNSMADHDTIVYHELIHFWQDFRNPYKHFYLTRFCRNFESSNDKNILLQGCPEDDVLEDEAVVKSRHIVQSLRAGYISGKIEEWPFGHFFTTQEV